jgi:hypothetical protein
MKTAVLLLILVLVLAPSAALAKGDNAGDLAAGGRVKGDISRDQGETDRITVTLDAGAALTIRFSASFRAHLDVGGPDGSPVDLGLQDGARTSVVGRPVATGGAYVVAVSSADGSQGLYTLVVKQAWPRRVTVDGAGRQVVDVAMPANGALAAVVRAAPGASGHPEIVGLDDPADNAILGNPIIATGAAARLPRTTVDASGVYHLTVDATDGASAWKATLTRQVGRSAQASLDLKNGLDQVSFRGDGVGAVFAHRCSSCHGFAASYGGVRGNLGKILPRVSGRSMPPGGGLSDREIALIFSWVRTGRAP